MKVFYLSYVPQMTICLGTPIRSQSRSIDINLRDENHKIRPMLANTIIGIIQRFLMTSPVSLLQLVVIFWPSPFFSENMPGTPYEFVQGNQFGLT